jgi:hypothetical protein
MRLIVSLLFVVACEPRAHDDPAPPVTFFTSAQ